jgi:hypothetical protein
MQERTRGVAHGVCGGTENARENASQCVNGKMAGQREASRAKPIEAVRRRSWRIGGLAGAGGVQEGPAAGGSRVWPWKQLPGSSQAPEAKPRRPPLEGEGGACGHPRERGLDEKLRKTKNNFPEECVV